jgi:hypothetical protein
MLAHVSCSFADLGYGRIRERVEEVVFRENKGSLVTLGIDVLKRFEGLIEAAIGRSRKRSSRGGQLWLCRGFGGMISLRRNILGDRTEGLRGPQLATRALEG